MREIKIFNTTGSFAENKDKAREIRINFIIPSLEKKEKVILDFEGVDSATQSFIHALISDVIKQKGAGALNNIFFKNCNEIIRKLIEIVTVYMQDSV
ncbi:MAG: STAS-like domain-containing protein [Nanoarchaeota archaeon]|nr:STAS-like domain-containing protein [Nanoarchaeota archaeon]